MIGRFNCPVVANNFRVAVVWTASYLAFGGVRTTTGTPIEARFPGQWFQSESGLHQNWMRDYDPTTGQYIEADPLGLIDGASVYGYAGQNPGRNTDATGQCIGPLAFLLPACVGAVYGVVAGWLADYHFGDACYTCDELLGDAALGAAYGAVGGVYG